MTPSVPLFHLEDLEVSNLLLIIEYLGEKSISVTVVKNKLWKVD